MLAILLFAFLPVKPACLHVTADRIYAGDLAQAVPAFAELAKELPVAFSPTPGQVRVFRPAELHRIAKANGLAFDGPGEVCFDWELHVPTVEELSAAMADSLPKKNIKAQIIDFSKYSIPPGKIVFPQLPSQGVFGTAAPMLWRGYVQYAGERHFLLWARVVLKGEGDHVVVTEPVRAGDPIHDHQLRLESWSGLLGSFEEYSSIDDVAGQIATRALQPGTVVLHNMLTAPNEVSLGDTVEVRINTEHALIRTEGVAEQTGVRGSIILIKNPTSGRKYRARIEGPGIVTVANPALSASGAGD